jgi:hypothetical protein
MVSKNFQKLTYTLFFKRNWTYLILIFSGAFLFEKGLDYAIDSAWENHNKGVLFF